MKRALTACLATALCATVTTCNQKDVEPAAPAAAVTRTKPDVVIKFSGLIAHVLGGEGQPSPRAVVLADYAHKVFLNFPDAIDVDQLSAVTRCGVPGAGNDECGISKPVDGRIEIGPIKGFSVRVVGIDPQTGKVSPLQPALDKTSPAFKEYVPSLMAASAKTAGKLQDSLYKHAPANSSDEWALFVPLEGGRLAAEKSCRKSKFRAGLAGSNDRWFAKAVILSGDVVGDPAIQFRTESEQPGWQTVAFKRKPVGSTMQVIAQPRAKLQESHFGHFRKVGNASKFDDIVYVDCAGSNLDPSCTNSQWP